MLKEIIYECSECLTTFNSDRPDEDARKEYEALYGDFAYKDTIKTICDTCYDDYMVWHNSLTEEDHKRIQGESNELD